MFLMHNYEHFYCPPRSIKIFSVLKFKQKKCKNFLWTHKYCPTGFWRFLRNVFATQLKTLQFSDRRQVEHELLEREFRIGRRATNRGYDRHANIYSTPLSNNFFKYFAIDSDLRMSISQFHSQVNNPGRYANQYLFTFCDIFLYRANGGN